MKKRKLLVAIIITVALLLIASCTMPDYQLNWDIVSQTQASAGASVVVGYTLENTGFEKLYDVTIQIEVRTGNGLYDVWTTPVSLNVGESTSTKYVYIYVGTSTFTDNTAQVIGAGWDIDDSIF